MNYNVAFIYIHIHFIYRFVKKDTVPVLSPIHLLYESKLPPPIPPRPQVEPGEADLLKVTPWLHCATCTDSISV